MTINGNLLSRFASEIVAAVGVRPPSGSAEQSSTRWAPPFSDSITSSTEPQQISTSTLITD